jgi:hypothetical protein
MLRGIDNSRVSTYICANTKCWKLGEREVTLPRRSNKEETRIQAEAKFKRKEAQAQAGAKAKADYEAEGRAIIERTARLKALRLAKATEAPSQTAPASSAKKRRLSRPR